MPFRKVPRTQARRVSQQESQREHEGQCIEGAGEGTFEDTSRLKSYRLKSLRWEAIRGLCHCSITSLLRTEVKGRRYPRPACDRSPCVPPQLVGGVHPPFKEKEPIR